MESASGSDRRGGAPRLPYVVYVALAITLGLWLRWPSLDAGFFSDDFVQPAMREGVYPAPRAPLDLFNFTDGSPSDHERLKSVGALPWWTVPGLRLAMMRPLSSALIAFDYELFGTDAFPYHVHSLLWWVLMMLAAALLLHRLFSGPIAALAILLFALEEGHTFPLIWLANRGALVAMVFGLLGLCLHLRARNTEPNGSLFGSFVCFSFALLTGEWAFPLLGYVLAYELFGHTGPLRQRLLALWPAALPGAMFLITRAYFHYGALNSGIYIDPITEPAAFLLAACQRIPVFFADLFFSVPAVWWGIGTPWRDFVLSLNVFSPQVWIKLPGWHFWHVTIGLFAIVATVLTLRAGLRDRPSEERKQIRWLLIGAFISLVPMVASFPTSRLVLPAAVAASAAAAIVILRSITDVRAHWSTHRVRAYAALATALLVGYFQIWQAARTSYHETRGLTINFAAIRTWMHDTKLDDSKVEDQSLVLVSSVEHETTVFFPWMRWLYGHKFPRAHVVLSAAPNAHDIYRPSANVLEVSVLGGTMLLSDLERLYRDDRFAFHVGDRFRTDTFVAEILRVRNGKPHVVRFTFDRNVNDSSYLFMYPSPEGLLQARLPEIGQRFRFRRAAFPDGRIARLVRNESDPSVTCNTVRPLLDECRVGYYFADCIPHTQPSATVVTDVPAVFACHGIGDCRWFTRGCVAEGYVASTCNERNVCCDAGWPFPEDSFASKAPFTNAVASGLAAWGTAPWDGERDMNVEVEIEPKLPSAQPQLLCAFGEHAELGPCGLDRVDVPPPQQSSLRFAFVPARLTGGFMITTEVIDDAAGQLHARICKVPLSTIAPFDRDPALCVRNTPAPSCATTGKLIISRFPVVPTRLSLLGARLHATFADGLRVEASF